MKKGWLVNDRLTCIPNTETFWHDLLRWIPGLENKAEGIDFPDLAAKIERDYNSSGNTPAYIVRNATFFRKLNLPTKTISLLQDNYLNGHEMPNQLDVCNHSDVTVFNSPYVHKLYSQYVHSKTEVIPLGTDFDFFQKLSNKQELKQKYGFKDEPYVIFIGAANNYPKGFDLLLDIISHCNYNFCLVMKDGYHTTHPNVKVFNRIDHTKLRDLINCCDAAICTSQMETLHLSGVECGACGIPIVATNVGIYHCVYGERWGHVCHTKSDFIRGLFEIIHEPANYDSRGCFLEMGLDKKTCQNKWINLINSLSE